MPFSQICPKSSCSLYLLKIKNVHKMGNIKQKSAVNEISCDLGRDQFHCYSLEPGVGIKHQSCLSVVLTGM